MATTFPVEQVPPPTSFKIQTSSPLDTLVRRTSAKRVRAAIQSTASQQYPLGHLIDDYAANPLQDEDTVDPYSGYTDPRHVPLSLPRQSQQNPPNSPLLHSHFARYSTATSSMNGSYLDSRSSVDSRNVYQELEYRYRDDESVYSQNDPPSPAIRDSWRSGASTGTVRPYDPTIPPSTPAAPSASTQRIPVPTVVVSSPDAENTLSRPGRAPVVRPITSNFSRPVRLSQPPQVTHPPPLPQNAEHQKRLVLERNANRAASTSPSSQPQHQDQMRFFRRSKPPSPSPPNPYLGTPSNRDQQPEHTELISPTDPLLNPYSDQPTPLHTSTPSNQHPGPSPVINAPHQTVPSQPLDQQTVPQSPQPQPSTSGNSGTGLSPVTLPRQPPPRTDSPASLYSTYSYYNFENAVPSPVNSNFSGPRTSPAHSPSPRPNGTKRLQPIYPEDNKQCSRSPNKTRTPSLTAPPEPQTPQDYLQLGIQSHEANRLKEAAMYFEKSAKENGGCGVGMLMWGLTLRHGWGCEKNEKVGFKWLRNAAESAVVDLESARGGKSVDTSSVQDELVLAIYEVGQCFFHGWGVHKDQKLAVSYYTVAARLGDPDAQNDLAFCLANGKGCKKDRKEAAKWYRAAVAQGVSDVGLAWIYKDKFM